MAVCEESSPFEEIQVACAHTHTNIHLLLLIIITLKLLFIFFPLSHLQTQTSHLAAMVMRRKSRRGAQIQRNIHCPKVCVCD